MASPSIEPAAIHFSDEALRNLRRRLRQSRLPDSLPTTSAPRGAMEEDAWDGGIDVAWLSDLLSYWQTDFDWRAVERDLNRHSPSFTQVDGLRIHFLHARSQHADALPLLLTHGWPGSVLEFAKIFDPLTDPEAHGGKASDAFHVVAPSIPGYGLSEAPSTPGYDIKALARTLAGLMARLGYQRYGAQGGDWGGMTSPYIALADPERCIGIHLNLVLAGPPPEGTNGLGEKDLAALGEARHYMRTGTAYQRVQGLEPDLIGVALNDSPAALCAWIVSKFRAWSDCNGDVESVFTRDELLANVTWYWLTKSAGTAARLYQETMRSGRFGPVESRVDTPTGCAIFPRELFRPPRAWAERLFHITRWTEMEAGGHFAAMEAPEALVEDIRAFFRPLR